MRVLVLGRQGQVARALVAAAGHQPSLELTAAGRETADLMKPGAADQLIRTLRPAIIINAAAFTAVDAAETQQEAALRLNAGMPGEAARAAAAIGSPFIHLSTDYVFDGSRSGTYREHDVPGPVNAYGQTKLAGEEAVRAAGGASTILRVSWVYGPHGANFMHTMLRLAASRAAVSVVDDQVACPTPADEIARVILSLVRAGVPGGLFHLAGPDPVNRADFARELFAASAAAGGPSAEVQPVPGSAFPTPAVRPHNTALDSGALLAATGQAVEPRAPSLARCMRQIAAAGWPA